MFDYILVCMFPFLLLFRMWALLGGQRLSAALSPERNVYPGTMGSMLCLRMNE